MTRILWAKQDFYKNYYIFLMEAENQENMKAQTYRCYQSTWFHLFWKKKQVY